MILKSVCPMVATDRLPETRAFYDWLGFKVVSAGPHVLELAWPEDPDLRIGFLGPDDPDRPEILRARFGGEGVVLRFDVEDVVSLYRRIGAVYTLAVKLRDDRSGRPHFAIVDPNGVVLEFVGPLRAMVEREERPDGAARPMPAVAARAVLFPQTVPQMLAG